MNEDEDEDHPIWTRAGNLVKKCILTEIIYPSLNGREEQIAGDPKSLDLNDYVYEGSILPHFGITDYVFLFDKAIGKFLPIPEQFEKIKHGNIRWLPRDYRDTKRYCWFTICLVSRSNHIMFKWPLQYSQPQCHDYTNCLSVTRDTQRIGYTIMSIVDTDYLKKIEKALFEKVKIINIF